MLTRCFSPVLTRYLLTPSSMCQHLKWEGLYARRSLFIYLFIMPGAWPGGTDLFDISAAWRPPELILGSMGSGQAIRRTWQHKISTLRVDVTSHFCYKRYIRIRIRIRIRM